MPESLGEKQKANELRKAGKYDEALEIYNHLWATEKDAYIGAGMLHCLRKLRRYDEAVPLADKIANEYPDIVWCRTEAIWTYIEGRIYKLGSDASLKDVKEIANKILQLNPEPIPLKLAVFRVMKAAKAINDWRTVNEWVTKVDPNTLSSKPMTDESGREGWSDQSLWSNYRIYALIETGHAEDAIKIVDDVIERFPKQRKFFLRLKALANYKLGNFEESEKIYADLCKRYKSDWWLIHEFAKVIRDLGRKEDALQLMYKSAIGSPKLEPLVTLFEDIGILCKDLGIHTEARAHLALSKHVRNEQGWAISEKLNNAINELNKILGDNNEPGSIGEALKVCKSVWQNALGAEDLSHDKKGDHRHEKRGLKGKLSLGPSSRPYCFINTLDNEAYFCLKKDLPSGVKDGCIVFFDATPSYDKKKQRDTWQAINITVKNNG